MGDRLVPLLDQMPRRLVGALLVLDENPRHAGAGHVLVDQDDIRLTVDPVAHPPVVGAAGQHDEPIDVAGAEAVDVLALDVGVAAGAHDQQRITLAPRLRLGRRRQGREEGVGDLRREQPDDLRGAKAQPLRQSVGAIGEKGAGFFDPARRFRRQHDGFVEMARNRRRRDLCGLGDVPNGGRSLRHVTKICTGNRFRQPVSYPLALTFRATGSTV